MASRSVRLFISCVSDEFGAYRDALRHALTRPNVEVKIQEDFKALGGDTLHVLQEYIEQCEAVVHFVGEMAGSAPPAASVEDLLARRPDLQGKLARKGLTREALPALTYTQWEAWLALGFANYLLIVAPAPGVESGPNFAATEASRESQTEHLRRLKAIDRHPVKFTSEDNLVVSILESAIIEALVNARAAPVVAKGQERFGPTMAAIVAGLFVLFIDRMLPLERWVGELPIFIRVLAAMTAGVFAWLAWRYWDILGDAGWLLGSPERADYDALLAGLKSGGTPAKVYRDWLTKALDRVDIFFGDPRRDDISWFARMLGLETPGARWTASAFDRCLLLALVYPIATIIAVWAWSGHVSVAERAIALWESPRDDALASFKRDAFGLALAVPPFVFWWYMKASRSDSQLGIEFGRDVENFLEVFLVAGFVAFGVAGAFAGAVALTVALSVAFAAAGFIPGAGALITAVAGSVAFAGLTVGVGPLSTAVTGSIAIVGGAAIVSISDWSVRAGRQRAFLSLFFPVATGAAFGSVFFLAPSGSWASVGPLLLFFGILTLVNAPFDWFAVGLTRALLRRGLAPGGQGPFFYALVDTLVAAPVIALLAFVAVFAVQTFDDIAVLRGGANAETLPLKPLFEGLDTRPGDPEFWWLWLMLFSTLIPSALNLCIAAASLIRGLPFLNAWIVKRMQTTGAMRDSDRLLVASALSAQIAGGCLATGVALYLIGVWFLPIWLPFLGGSVRDFSEALAAYNAPARIMIWFVGAH